MATNLLFDKELKELAAVGITADKLTADEICELVEACKRMASPYSGINKEAVGFPVRVGETTLYRLTIGASCWLDEFASKWWPENSKSFFWAMVYALVHAREPEAFEDMTNEKDAHARILKMGLAMPYTEAELMDAINELMPNRCESNEKGHRGALLAPDWASVAQTLELATGLPVSVWCWLRSADWVVAEYNKQIAFIKSMHGEASPRLRDELDKATTHLARVRSAIIARIEAEKGDEAK